MQNDAGRVHYLFGCRLLASRDLLDRAPLDFRLDRCSAHTVGANLVAELVAGSTECRDHEGARVALDEGAPPARGEQSIDRRDLGEKRFRIHCRSSTQNGWWRQPAEIRASK